MRTFQKQQILDIIDSIYEVQEQVKLFIVKGEWLTAQNLLADCQETAVEVGSIIEELDGTIDSIIVALEEYCKALFIVYKGVSTKEWDTNSYEESSRKLDEFRNRISEDIISRLEVVFLPYKASMWDSLESIYLAAIADPNCDAYVVPIPYFDRTSNGALGNMHYEGTQYPKEIPVVDWQSYNIESRKPDIIYIHNPYDNYNLVTSIHPNFYGERLKKYTRQLVYVPYFVLEEIDSDDFIQTRGMRHFCFLPGTIYADKVVLQSENIRRVYINEYKSELQKRNLKIDDQEIEEKFIALGSPKFDKVIKAQSEKYSIPSEWLKIIQKSDGSFKKIVFYNTTIGAMLEDTPQMLQKVQSVFDYFEQRKETLALLWRPHPLLESTFKSMRPEYYPVYRQLIGYFKSKQIGILDQTADLEKSIALSDVYYGDRSSVIPLFCAIGKRALVQNINNNIHEENDFPAPEIGLGVKVDNKLWFCPYNYNAIFSIDILNGKVELKGSLLNEKRDQRYLTGAPIEKDGLICFVSTNAKHIQVYDTKSNKNCMFEESDNNYIGCFSKAYEEKETFYIFPASAKYMVKIRHKNQVIERDYAIVALYEETFKTKYNILSKSDIYRYKNQLCMAIWEKPAILFFDLKAESMQYKILKKSKSGFCLMSGKDNYAYLLGIDSHLVRYNLKDGEEEVFEININCKTTDFKIAFRVSDNIYFCTGLDNKCLKFNTTSFAYELTTLEKEWGIDSESKEIYRFVYLEENKRLYLISNFYRLASIDLGNNHVSYQVLEFNKEELTNYYLAYKDENNYAIEENSYWNMSRAISYTDHTKKSIKLEECGKVIYKKCKGYLE